MGYYFKNTKSSNFFNVMVNVIPLDNSWGKKLIFEKNTFYFESEYVFSISSVVKEIS